MMTSRSVSALAEIHHRLSKALALRTDLPQIAFDDLRRSERRPSWARHQRKVTLKSPKVLPEVVIYDVNLTMSLPTLLSATSGSTPWHTRSRRYAEDRNPVIDLWRWTP
jgi:hypothetical protein